MYGCMWVVLSTFINPYITYDKAYSNQNFRLPNYDDGLKVSNQQKQAKQF